jgi:hypothetical protein
VSDIRTDQAEVIEPYTCLMQILMAHPGIVTEDDVLAEIAMDDPATFLERDRVETGIRELISVGLVRREGRSLVPTPATLLLDDHLVV